MFFNKNIIKDKYLEIIRDEWLQSSDTFPDFLSEIPIKTKSGNESYIHVVSTEYKKHINSFPRIPIGRKRWRHKMLCFLQDILYNENVIGLHKSLNKGSIDALLDELIEFLRHVRQFAPELSYEEIGQALRNYIVYVMFKKINKIESTFSKAAFAYSMLYPVTDNYIDNPAHSPAEKAEYNKIIKDKILGYLIKPKSKYQKKTCDLLQLIETDYPRDNNISINNLLLMMLEAQEQSLSQQQSINNNQDIDDRSSDHVLTANERLNISLYKGGISVIIDRFLINKEMTDDDMRFYLGMGFFLQLADDLQDIKKDNLQINQTLFTISLDHKHEEKLVNKMLHFIYNITNNYKADNEIFKNFVLSNCYHLVFTSIAGSKEFFSNKYHKQIEIYLPVTYQCLNQFQTYIGSDTPKDNMKLLDFLIKPF